MSTRITHTQSPFRLKYPATPPFTSINDFTSFSLSLFLVRFFLFDSRLFFFLHGMGVGPLVRAVALKAYEFKLLSCFRICILFPILRLLRYWHDDYFYLPFVMLEGG